MRSKRERLGDGRTWSEATVSPSLDMVVQALPRSLELTRLRFCPNTKMPRGSNRVFDGENIWVCEVGVYGWPPVGWRAMGTTANLVSQICRATAHQTVLSFAASQNPKKTRASSVSMYSSRAGIKDPRGLLMYNLVLFYLAFPFFRFISPPKRTCI